jgi:hypothetical protein
MNNDTLQKFTHKGKSHVEWSIVTDVSQKFAPSILMVAQKVENCLSEQICTTVEMVSASSFRTAILTLNRKRH